MLWSAASCSTFVRFAYSCLQKTTCFSSTCFLSLFPEAKVSRIVNQRFGEFFSNYLYMKGCVYGIPFVFNGGHAFIGNGNHQVKADLFYNMSEIGFEIDILMSRNLLQ